MKLKLRGYFRIRLKDEKGNILCEEPFNKNMVTTLGANLALDTLLEGSAYTVTGPYVGIISSVSYTGLVIADTMASHGGWTEAGPTNAPDYSGSRKTLTFSAASSRIKASTLVTFTFSASGTIKGCFVVLGSGASATKDNTGGVLYAQALFIGGDKVVTNGYVLEVQYSSQI